MSTHVLVVYYSLHGHVEKLAGAVGAGAESIRNTEVRVRRVPDSGDEKPIERAVDEATHDDIRWADAVAWGTPTRYGIMATPLKRFFDPHSPASLRNDFRRNSLRPEPADSYDRSDRRLAVRTFDDRGPRRPARRGPRRIGDRAQPRRAPCTRRLGAQDRSGDHNPTISGRASLRHARRVIRSSARR